MSDPVLQLQACLDALGFTDDPEMERTAERVTELLREFVPGRPTPEISRCAVTTPGPVVVRGLQFHSLCAHHLLPFFGHVAIAYRPDDAVVGLGSVPRLVDHVARRPQTQERLAEQLADLLFERIAPRALAVGVVARHLCMEMRGARASAQVTVLCHRGDPDPWLLSQVEDPIG